MSKFVANMSMSGAVVIEAKDAEEAMAIAEDMLDERSVYEDEKVKNAMWDAYYSGGTGRDYPFRKKQAYDIRDFDFTPDKPIIEKYDEEDEK